jgi:hypothetical protein
MFLTQRRAQGLLERMLSPHRVSRKEMSAGMSTRSI